MVKSRPYSRRRIRYRLPFSLVAIVVFTALVIILAASLSSFQNARRQVIAQLESIATLKQSETVAWLDTLRLDLRTEVFSGPIAERIRVMTTSPTYSAEYQTAYADQFTHFIETISERSHFEEFFIMDPEGRTIISTDPTQVGKQNGSRDYFQQGLNNLYISSPYYTISIGRYSVILSMPVHDNRGQLMGVIAGRASLKTLSDIMQIRAGLGETGETYLIGSNYVLLTESRFDLQDQAGAVYVRTEGATAAVEGGQDGSGLYENYRGSAVVGVYHWIPELSVALLAEQDQGEAFGPTYAALGLSISLAVLATMVALVVGLRVANGITGPLGQLAAAAGKVAAGELQTPLELERGDEIGDLSASLASMTMQLQEIIATLEQRVAERTQAIQTSSEVGRRLSTILDQEHLVAAVVEEVQQAFNYYHAQIYLADESGRMLIMAGGTGEAGRTMLAQGHKIPIDRGLVGRAAQDNRSVLVTDTNADPNWLPNALLPKTRAEVAIPISSLEGVLGVLDVQHDQVGGLDEQDVELLQAISNQVAVAVVNARRYRQSQQQAEIEMQANLISQRIQATTSVEDALQTTLRQLAQALGVSKGVIELSSAQWLEDKEKL